MLTSGHSEKPASSSEVTGRMRRAPPASLPGVRLRPPAQNGLSRRASLRTAQRLENHEDAAWFLVLETQHLHHNSHQQNSAPHPAAPHPGTSAIAIPEKSNAPQLLAERMVSSSSGLLNPKQVHLLGGSQVTSGTQRCKEGREMYRLRSPASIREPQHTHAPQRG